MGSPCWGRAGGGGGGCASGPRGLPRRAPLRPVVEVVAVADVRVDSGGGGRGVGALARFPGTQYPVCLPPLLRRAGGCGGGRAGSVAPDASPLGRRWGGGGWRRAYGRADPPRLRKRRVRHKLLTRECAADRAAPQMDAAAAPPPPLPPSPSQPPRARSAAASSAALSPSFWSPFRYSSTVAAPRLATTALVAVPGPTPHPRSPPPSPPPPPPPPPPSPRRP